MNSLLQAAFSPAIASPARVAHVVTADTERQQLRDEATDAELRAIENEASIIADEQLRTGDGMAEASDYSGFFDDLAYVYAATCNNHRLERLNLLFDRLADRIVKADRTQAQARARVECDREMDAAD